MSDNNTSKTTVLIEGYGDRRFRQWAKRVTSVDLTKTNGYAFDGQFLTLGRKYRLPVGAIVLFFGRFSSEKRNSPAVRVCVVRETGLEIVFERKRLNESWALEVMKDVAAILKRHHNTPPTRGEELKIEPGTTLSIARAGGWFVATLKTPPDDVVYFALSPDVHDALVVLNVAPDARRSIEALFAAACVDVLRASYDNGWSSELKYWRDGEIREHRVNAITLPAVIDALVVYLLKGE